VAKPHTCLSFTRKSQLHRYCKLGVVDRTSDGKPLGYQRLDKAGNSELKAMRYRAYLCAIRIQSPNEVRMSYEKSLRCSKSATNARLNTQRKRLPVIDGVWRKRRRIQQRYVSRTRIDRDGDLGARSGRHVLSAQSWFVGSGLPGEGSTHRV
jgi:hypothetical protein